MTKDGNHDKTWGKAGVNALGGAIVGATGGLGAGLIATGATAYADSLAEDAIDGNELNHNKILFLFSCFNDEPGVAVYRSQMNG